jgi:Pyruvate/2-oxoacid:ferredoxin oxidoreductase delta subunit
MSKDRIDGNIGIDLTYCDGCGLEAEDCKCDEALADEVLEGEEEEE